MVLYNNTLINIVIFIGMALSLVLSKQSNPIWIYISQASILLSCFISSEKISKKNIVLAIVLILTSVFGFISQPTLLSALTLLAFALLCTIDSDHKSTVAIHFLSSLLLIALAFEHLSLGSTFYFSIEQTIYFVMGLGTIIIMKSKRVNFSPIMIIILYSLGASFNQIQYYILFLLLIYTLLDDMDLMASTSLLLLLWVSPGHLWFLVLITLFVLPKDLARWFEGRSRLIAILALGASILMSTEAILKIPMVAYFMVMCCKLVPIKTRVENA